MNKITLALLHLIFTFNSFALTYLHPITPEDKKRIADLEKGFPTVEIQYNGGKSIGLATLIAPDVVLTTSIIFENLSEDVDMIQDLKIHVPRKYSSSDQEQNISIKKIQVSTELTLALVELDSEPTGILPALIASENLLPLPKKGLGIEKKMFFTSGYNPYRFQNKGNLSLGRGYFTLYNGTQKPFIAGQTQYNYFPDDPTSDLIYRIKFSPEDIGAGIFVYINPSQKDLWKHISSPESFQNSFRLVGIFSGPSSELRKEKPFNIFTTGQLEKKDHANWITIAERKASPSIEISENTEQSQNLPDLNIPYNLITNMKGDLFFLMISPHWMVFPKLSHKTTDLKEAILIPKDVIIEKQSYAIDIPSTVIFKNFLMLKTEKPVMTSDPSIWPSRYHIFNNVKYNVKETKQFIILASPMIHDLKEYAEDSLAALYSYHKENENLPGTLLGFTLKNPANTLLTLNQNSNNSIRNMIIQDALGVRKARSIENKELENIGLDQLSRKDVFEDLIRKETDEDNKKIFANILSSTPLLDPSLGYIEKNKFSASFLHITPPALNKTTYLRHRFDPKVGLGGATLYILDNNFNTIDIGSDGKSIPTNINIAELHDNLVLIKKDNQFRVVGTLKYQLGVTSINLFSLEQQSIIDNIIIKNALK